LKLTADGINAVIEARLNRHKSCIEIQNEALFFHPALYWTDTRVVLKSFRTKPFNINSPHWTDTRVVLKYPLRHFSPTYSKIEPTQELYWNKHKWRFAYFWQNILNRHKSCIEI